MVRVSYKHLIGKKWNYKKPFLKHNFELLLFLAFKIQYSTRTRVES